MPVSNLNLKLVYIHLFSVQVSLARRQPVIDPINDASSRFVKIVLFSA